MKIQKIKCKLFDYRFPNSEHRRKLWKDMFHLHNNQSLDWNEKHRICALHFSPNDFITPTTISETAKPSIFGAATERRRREM